MYVHDSSIQAGLGVCEAVDEVGEVTVGPVLPQGGHHQTEELLLLDLPLQQLPLHAANVR